MKVVRRNVYFIAACISIITAAAVWIGETAAWIVGGVSGVGVVVVDVVLWARNRHQTDPAQEVDPPYIARTIRVTHTTVTTRETTSTHITEEIRGPLSAANQAWGSGHQSKSDQEQHANDGKPPAASDKTS